MHTPFLSTCAKIRTRCRCPRTRSRPCTRALKWALGPYVTCFSVGSEEFYPQSTSSHTLTPCNAPFAKMVSAERAKWTKDNLGTQSVDKAPFSVAEPNIQMGGGGVGAVVQTLRGDARSQKNFFSSLCVSVWSKNKGAGLPGPSPRSATDFVTVPGHYSPGTKCEGTPSLLLTSHVNLNSNFRIRYSFPFSVSLALRKANFVGRNTDLK